jgi:hypothetical protein
MASRTRRIPPSADMNAHETRAGHGTTCHGRGNVGLEMLHLTYPNVENRVQAVVIRLPVP